jgi:cobalt-zinc-cadmium efflux system outer membrane protein
VLEERLHLQVAEHELRVARAEAVGVGRWPNPAIGWQREASSTRAAGTQDIVYASIPLVLSGRLGFERTAAEHRADAARARAERTRSLLQHEAVRAFESVVAVQAQRVALEASLSALEELVRLVEVRERAGEASGYDAVRIQLEHDNLTTQLHGLRGAQSRAAIEAAGLLGQPGRPLPPLNAVPEAASQWDPKISLAALVERHPELRALELEARSAEAARRAAARGAVPDPTLEVGVQLLDTGRGALDSGYTVGIEVPLPLFTRQEAQEARASAARDLSRAQRSLLLRAVQTQLLAALDDLDHRREQRLAHQQGALARTEELRRIAAASYRGGASDLLVLLDAERNARDARLMDIELQSAASNAENDLRLLSGDYDGATPRGSAP